VSRSGSSADWAEMARRELAERLDAGVEERGEGDGDASGPYWRFVSRLERSIIEEALGRSRGNQIQAARLLGINRNTLRKKIVELGIGGASDAEAE